MNPHATFALIIGIDKYQSPDYSDLEAAANDANKMTEYLQSVLGVPEQNIINLRNEQASRRGILDGFQALQTLTGTAETATSNPCIIIFYAGHGARTEKPMEWEDWAMDSAQVEMLCPYDIGMPLGTGDNRVVEGIPDRTVCYLLNQLSKLRGNNITLILDCCCSAGLNRGSSDRIIVRRPRHITNPPRLSGRSDPEVVIRNDEDNDAEESDAAPTRGMKRAAGFGGKFQDSHVLLAACGRDSVAYEHEGSGLFTSVLLSLLPTVNLQTMTYASLMTRMKMPKWQTPHCEGSSIDRPLFSRVGVRSDPSYIPGRRSKSEDGKLSVTLDAGMAQGIVLGELFSIYENNFEATTQNPNPSIGLLDARTISTASCSLGHPPGQKKFKIPRHFYAKRIDWRNDPPKVYCADSVLLSSLFPSPENVAGRKIIAVEDPEQASLVISTQGDDVRISRTDPFITQYIPPAFPYNFHTESPWAIHRIVGAWQHFNYHLLRRGRDEFPQVRMELHYLEPSSNSGEDDENYKVKGGNLLAAEPAEVRVPDVDVEKPLGMTLYNDGDVPLYPYLFYFDPNDLTIIPWFTAPFGAGLGNVDPPLEARSQFPIGYGNGAATPWQFCFEDDRDRDVGFFKLFLSVSPVNFHSLIQEESPVKSLGLSGTRSGTIPTTIQPTPEYNEHSWGVKVATVIQLRE